MPNLYESQVEPGAGPDVRLGQMQVPNLPGLSAGGEGLQRLGGAVDQFAQVMRHAATETQDAAARIDYIKQSAALSEKYAQSTDFEKAGADHARELQQLQAEQAARIQDPARRQQTQLWMTAQGVSAQKGVNAAQLKNSVDFSTAGLNTQTQEGSRQWAGAASPAEQAAVVARTHAAIDQAEQSGVISSVSAAARKLQFSNGLDRLAVGKDTLADPQGTLEKLQKNPEYARSLDPEVRQQFAEAAAAKSDAQRRDMVNRVTGLDPVKGIVGVGQIADQAQADWAWTHVIRKVENSSGDNSVVNEAGAIGLSQILVGTARGQARKLGLTAIAALSDGDLTMQLRTNPDLNLRLGKSYFDEGLQRYNGNLAAAGVFYHSGPGNSDKWVAEATARFGANYSGDELKSVIPASHPAARQYIDFMAKFAGVPLGSVKFNNPHAAFAAANDVSGTIQQNEGRLAGVAKTLASTVSAQDDVTQLLKQGADVSPVRIEQYRAANAQAAAYGDTAAQGRLRDLEAGLTLQPVIQQAWQMRPGDLDTAAQNLRAQLFAPSANATTGQMASLHALEAVRNEQVGKRDSEPVVLGGQSGGRYYTLTPLEPNGQGGDAGFAAALAERDRQALRAHAIFGGSGSPFTTEEVKGFKERLASGTSGDRLGLLAGMAKSLSPQTYQAAVKALGADDPLTTFAAGLANVDPQLGLSLAEGQKAMNADARYAPQKGANAQTYYTAKSAALPANAFPAGAARSDDTGPFAALNQAVDARYAFLSAQAGDTSGVANDGRLKQAARDVTGGVLSHNGGPVIAPARGMSQADFDSVLFHLGPQDLARARTGGGAPVTADYLWASSKLHALGQGRYVIQLNQDDANPLYARDAGSYSGGAFSGGGAFVLDLRGRKPLAAAFEPASSDPYSTALP